MDKWMASVALWFVVVVGSTNVTICIIYQEQKSHFNTVESFSASFVGRFSPLKPFYCGMLWQSTHIVNWIPCVCLKPVVLQCHIVTQLLCILTHIRSTAKAMWNLSGRFQCFTDHPTHSHLSVFPSPTLSPQHLLKKWIHQAAMTQHCCQRAFQRK